MNALTKFSIALLSVTATAIAVYLYATAADEGFHAARSEPRSAICKQDGERLARLRASPSLDEGLRFLGEIRCIQLWPQLQTVVESLSEPSRSTALSKLDPAVPNTMSGSDAESSPGAASATLDDTCTHDEDRLAELRANPSVAAAIRFDNELKCPRLKPQLPDILSQLGHDAGSVELANGKPPTSDATSAGAAAPPASEPPASEATSAASDDACKQDEERMALLRTTPSGEEAARFTRELRCETLRPELLALTAALASLPESASVSENAGAQMNATHEAPPAPQAAADAERRIAQLESEKGALAAEVSRLQQQASSDGQASATPSPPPAGAAERSESPFASAAADAQRRIAQLESENEALTTEVSRLQRDREAPSADEAKSPPAPPPAAHAKRAASDPFTALASLPTGMPGRVLIRYLPNNGDARAQAEMLASVLQRQGIEVADLRESRSAIRPEVSFAYAHDETIAQQVGRLVGVAPVRRLQPKDGLMVRPGTVELNLSGDSHHLATIKTTSTGESNHE